MKIERLVLEPLENNCYIISNNSLAIIIDPSSNEEIIERFLKDNSLNLVAIFITHYHFDHIGALNYFKSKYKIEIFDYKNVGKINILGLDVEIIETKGHSKDSVSFYFKDSNDLFVGDFIFENSIGRMDLLGGDEKDMVYSLNFLKTFPKSTKLYPGHGNLTTLERELINNPYL